VNARDPLKIGDGRDWHFVNGAWQDGEDGVLAVPADLRRADGDAIQGHHYAFHRDLCYADVCVRFTFRLTSHSDIGIVLRARDESHFYLLHFPNCGQASRAQHFWVALSRMDESGYLRRIKMEMVRRVPSNSGLWLPAEIVLTGNCFTVRIGEHGRFTAEDDAYPKSGRLGVYSFGDAAIRGLSVEGEAVDPAPWDQTASQQTNWFHPCPDARPGIWQRPIDLLRFADGELLLSFAIQERSFQGRVTSHLARSGDGGRTWSDPEPLRVSARDGGWEPDRLHLTPAGRLISLSKEGDAYLIAESTDRGRTWSELAPAGLAPAPPGLPGIHLPPQAFLNLADGSIVLFGYGARRDLMKEELTIYTWGSFHCQSFACRSTDDGRTWSTWVNLDNAGVDDHFDPNEPDRELGRPIAGNLDLTEACAVQMGDGRIMVLIRPIYSPWMWETWSGDGGVTWGPCVRGPFPGYATPNMLRTSNGAVLVAHRLPSMTVQTSWDDGGTWDEGTLIDSATWVMGAMVEVEPGVVLYVYWDSFESLMRAQRILPTRAGLEPVRASEISS
jgi:hypothetical protein